MKQENFVINKCIYCNGVGETNEHIIPFALGGRQKLLKASCKSCRDITSRCEHNPLNKNWAEVRAVLDYPSRHRDFGNEKFSLEVTFKDGSEGVLKLSKSEVLGLTVFLEYPLPAFFAPDNYKKGVNVIGSSLISFGPNVSDLLKKYGIKTIRHMSTHKGNDFEKMIAKISYCAAVALFGLDSFDQCSVLPALLGKKDDIGFWMGCDPEGRIIPLIGKQRFKNIIKIHVLKKDKNNTRYVIARLKFFASSDAPEYIVLVGTLKPDFIIPDHQSFSY